MTTPKYYILDGKQPKKVDDPVEWQDWYAKSIRDRVLAHHEIKGKVIRTVFTGLDFGGKVGRPCLFDSYIWGKDEDDPEHTETHCTYESAIAAHNRLVEETERVESIKAKWDPPAPAQP